jgi:SanA protein
MNGLNLKEKLFERIKLKLFGKISLPKKGVRLFYWFSIGIFAFILFSNLLVRFSYQGFIYDSTDSIPSAKAGLVLGTSKYLKGGFHNPYYEYRIQAAVELFRAGKIKYIIVSGDNRFIHYNEPAQMRDDLISRGISPEFIFLDYAGFRTLDSVIRANKIFGQDRFIIISQPFHNQRAVFIARFRGIDAIAFNAKDVNFSLGMKVRFREIFARVKLVVDLFIIQKQPKFLGEKVIIGS